MLLLTVEAAFSNNVIVPGAMGQHTFNSLFADQNIVLYKAQMNSGKIESGKLITIQ